MSPYFWTYHIKVAVGPAKGKKAVERESGLSRSFREEVGDLVEGQDRVGLSDRSNPLCTAGSRDPFTAIQG